MHFRTQPLWPLLVKLALYSSNHCTNFQRFYQRLCHQQQHSTPPPPMSQAPSQFRNTVPPAPVHMLGYPYQASPALATPILPPRLARYPSQRVSPIQGPSPRVAPRVNPVNVASLRVNPTLPHQIVFPLTLHPVAATAPCVPQGTAGVNIFEKIEEEHMEAPALSRYTTRARARQHSANTAHHHSSRHSRGESLWHI
jgi:hypothetical protein